MKKELPIAIEFLLMHTYKILLSPVLCKCEEFIGKLTNNAYKK